MRASGLKSLKGTGETGSEDAGLGDLLGEWSLLSTQSGPWRFLEADIQNVTPILPKKGGQKWQTSLAVDITSH